MGALLSPVAWYYRTFALVALVLAAMAFGWVKGTAKFEAYRATVETAGKAQATKNTGIAKKGVEISTNVGANYEKANSNLRGVYGPGRMLHPVRGSRKASPVPKTPAGTDERPADAGSGPGELAPGCEALKSDAAATTLQFLYLRQWIDKQAELWNSNETLATKPLKIPFLGN